MPICTDEKLDINGTKQFVSVRAQRSGLPLLVYLHGGPGDAALPLVHKYNRDLESNFTVAVWEQRGAGKSYYPFGADEHLTIDVFVQDARCLIEQLLERFRQKKIYLVGHSWGSVLGLLLCKKYPHLIHTYIGCGQVVQMKKSCRLAYDFAMEHATEKMRTQLAQIDCSYSGKNWLEDLLFVTRQVVKQGGSLYGANSYNRFVWDFIRSKDYTMRDLLCREKGALQSIRCLWPELMNISFKDVTTFELPIVFIEGRQDFHVSSQLAKEYFDLITTPKQIHWFEQSAHFPQWSEAEKFHQILCSLIVEV